MTSNRLEAFSDGVLAIILTIMVLELEPPESYDMEAIAKVFPSFVIYFISFLYIGIYWIGHHNLFKLSEKVNGKVLWANLLLLFWLSLIPFTTNWVGEDDFGLDAAPVIVYGFVLLMSKFSYLHLRIRIVKQHEKDAPIVEIIKPNKKDAFVILLYLVSFALTLVKPHFGIISFLFVGILKVLYIRHFSIKV